MRCSGLTLGLMLPTLLLGGTAPLAAISLLSSSTSLAAPAWVMISASCVTGAVVAARSLRALAGSGGSYAQL
jgi:hypothetical protein